MFIHRNTKKVANKVYHSILLMHNYRQEGKIKHKVILNLSKLPAEHIKALEASIKGQRLFSLDDIKTKEGKSIGALLVFKELAKRKGILKILGESRQGKLAMLLIIGRLLTQGSRLYLCDWGKEQELQEVLGIDRYDEDDLYETLDWLAKEQQEMEHKLYKINHKNEPPRFFLYDVTSSYLEGQCNELAKYGYNRDGKKGKKQIVIGLLTDGEGEPVSIEVFEGNTRDMTTVSSQIKKIASSYGVNEIVFVGDRGMIKSAQIEELQGERFYYITAITKPEIETLLKQGHIQLGLFDEEIMEVIVEGLRYVLRRNPVRVEEIRHSRQQKFNTLFRKAEILSRKLREHPRAHVATALKEINELAAKLKITVWVRISTEGRNIVVISDEEILREVSKLDGCYVIKTNLGKKYLSAQGVHDRYKDLALIEHAFRTIKTGFLEVRPIFVRKESRTRGHLFVTMLAYMLVNTFWKNVRHLGKELHHMIDSLDAIKTVILSVATTTTTTTTTIKRIPEPPDYKKDILKALHIRLPSTL